MKPVDFTLHRPETLDEAVSLLATYAEDGKLLAGGQSLVPLLNFRLARPEHVIDIGRIASLAAIRRSADELVIGAMVTHQQAGRSATVGQAAPLIACALPHIAHRAIRARGTVGGSIAHGDPAAELPAVVTALDAQMIALSSRGPRTIPAAEFFHGNLATALAPDEILTEIRLRSVPERTGAAFDEVSRRVGDFALVGAGAQVQVDANGTVVDARIALTGVSGTPHRAARAEQILLGHRVDAGLLEAAAQAVREAVSPSGDLHATAEYRRHVGGTLVGRVVALAADRAVADTEQPRRTA